MKNILITGAAGFIGSNLSEHLCKKGYNVTGLDNFATGSSKNIERLLLHDNFRFIEGDIRNIDTCNLAIKEQQVVLHQAALGSVPRSIANPLTSNEVNVSGFLNVLHSCVQNNVNRFVFAASSSTYGDNTNLPKVEHTIGKPLSPYAVTKYVNELYADVFAKTYGIETIGLRYFNVFGRYQDPNGAYAAVIPTFVKKFMNHEAVQINGDGSYSRDFTYIDNVIQANVLAMETTNTAAVNQVYNIAFGERTTISDLALNIRKGLTTFDPKIENVSINYGPNRQGDVPHSLASIDKAQSLLGYQPKFDIKSGLEQSIKWYWENL